MGSAGPISIERMAMKLRPPSYLALGMLRLGASSGYAIKKATDVSTRFFWPTSLAQVYPELARLEEAGMVERSDDSHGARRRSSYSVTAAGERALRTWLGAVREGPTQFRDEGVLRLFFADALPPAEQVALVRRLRGRAETTATRIGEGIVPMAEAFEAQGFRFPAIVARLGADTYAFAAEWLARLAEELEADANGDARPQGGS
jgi:DNA-binding PadR family transcriptional regulator